MNFENIFQLFLEETRLTAKISTAAHYHALFNNHIARRFGNRNAESISESELITHILEEKDNNLRDLGRSLSQKSICDIITLLNSIFKYARENGFMKAKLHIPVPKCPQNKVEIFTPDEKAKIKEYIFSNVTYHGIAILLSLFMGLRLGEACALTWNDIDFETETLRVSRTLQRVKDINGGNSAKTKVVIDTPKSEKSIRDIPVPEFLLPLLNQFKGDKDCYVSTNTVDYAEPRLLQKKYKTLLKKAGVNYRKYHATRHTFATDAYNNGMGIKSLSEILGHADIETTLRLYVHTSFEQKQREMNHIYADMRA